jgi:hypothetical protein
MFQPILIFLIILTLYLHIFYHLKKSNDLEIYETTFTTKENLDNISKLRQPVVFNYDLNLVECERNFLIKNFSDKKINLKNIISNDSVPLNLSESIHLIDTDKKGSYYSEKNKHFLDETIIDKIKKREQDIIPVFTCCSIYDILFGSNNSYTPLQYDINYKNYLYIAEGEVKIRMTPPINEKYLDIFIDYETMDITSRINVWKEQNIENVKFIDIVVEKGNMIYIPPYWLYSIKFIEPTTIISFKYRTYMNLLAILPHLFIQMLQLQNIKPILNTFDSKIVQKNKKPKNKKKVKKENNI